MGAKRKVKMEPKKLGYRSWDEALDEFIQMKAINESLSWEAFCTDRKVKTASARFKKQIKTKQRLEKDKTSKEAWEEFKKTQEWKDIVEFFEDLTEDDDGDDWKNDKLK